MKSRAVSVAEWNTTRDENHGVGDASACAEYRAFWRNDGGGERKMTICGGDRREVLVEYCFLL